MATLPNRLFHIWGGATWIVAYKITPDASVINSGRRIHFAKYSWNETSRSRWDL